MFVTTRIKPRSPLAGWSGMALSVILLSASVAACSSDSSEPRLGDTIRSQGVELSQIGDLWTEGDDLVDDGRDRIEDGQEMIAKGNKLISKGEASVEKGRDDVTRGQQMKREAETTYRARTGLDLPVED